jgi:hypothetical protein
MWRQRWLIINQIIRDTNCEVVPSQIGPGVPKVRTWTAICCRSQCRLRVQPFSCCVQLPAAETVVSHAAHLARWDPTAEKAPHQQTAQQRFHWLSRPGCPRLGTSFSPCWTRRPALAMVPLFSSVTVSRVNTRMQPHRRHQVLAAHNRCGPIRRGCEASPKYT